jgi:hypothetical protein
MPAAFWERFGVPHSVRFALRYARRNSSSLRFYLRFSGGGRRKQNSCHPWKSVAAAANGSLSGVLSALGFHVDAVERPAGGHKQPILLQAAEAEVRADLR